MPTERERDEPTSYPLDAPFEGGGEMAPHTETRRSWSPPPRFLWAVWLAAALVLGAVALILVF